MNKIRENIQKLFEKYRFTEPTPGDIQKLALDSVKRNIISILKKNGDYSLIFGRVLGIYLRGKRLGVKLSFTQSRFILALTAVITVSLVSLTAYILFSQFDAGRPGFNRDRIIHEKQTIGEEKTGGSERRKKERENINSSGILTDHEFELGIGLYSGADRKIAEKTANRLFEELKLRMGADKILMLKNQKRPGVKRILTGSIRKLGNSYYLTSKLIRVENGKIEYALSENIDGPLKTEKAISAIAEKIACHIEKCE